MRELKMEEIEEVSGSEGIVYWIAYGFGYVVSSSRVAQDEWAWSGGG